MTQETEQAREIARTLETAGGRELIKWVENRINTLIVKQINSEDMITVDEIRVDSIKKGAKKIEVTILNLSKNKDRAELRAWKLILAKFADWEKMARGQI